MYPHLENMVCTLDANVLTVTLDRPDALNAMTAAMGRQLCELLDLTDADDRVRAIVFTGAGRAFCAGFDLSAGAGAFAQGATLDDGQPRPDGGGVLALRLYHSKKPLIGAVNGAAVGIGATMLLPMDIRIASEQARFGFVFARRGIVPDGCSSWFLPRVVGIARALAWTLSGRLVPAQEALAAGLVSEVCAPGDLLARAHALALEIADNAAPVSAALTRQMLWTMLAEPDPAVAHALESRALAARRVSDDAREGVAAFLEKRPPAFTGKVSTDMPPLA